MYFFITCFKQMGGDSVISSLEILFLPQKKYCQFIIFCKEQVYMDIVGQVNELFLSQHI